MNLKFNTDNMEKLIVKIKEEKEKAEFRYTEYFAKEEFKTVHINEGMILAFSLVLKWYNEILNSSQSKEALTLGNQEEKQKTCHEESED